MLNCIDYSIFHSIHIFIEIILLHYLQALLAAAPHVPVATGVVSFGAPASAVLVSLNFATDLAEIVEKGTAKVSLAGRSFTITKQFLDDIAEQNFLVVLA